MAEDVGSPKRILSVLYRQKMPKMAEGPSYIIIQIFYVYLRHQETHSIQIHNSS